MILGASPLARRPRLKSAHDHGSNVKACCVQATRHAPRSCRSGSDDSSGGGGGGADDDDDDDDDDNGGGGGDTAADGGGDDKENDPNYKPAEDGDQDENVSRVDAEGTAQEQVRAQDPDLENDSNQATRGAADMAPPKAESKRSAKGRAAKGGRPRRAGHSGHSVRRPRRRRATQKPLPSLKIAALQREDRERLVAAAGLIEATRSVSCSSPRLACEWV